MNVKVELETSVIADLAIEAWRLTKLRPSNAKERIAISRFLKQLFVVLETVDVKLLDLTAQPYDQGMAVEIIHTENADETEPYDEIIAETIRPTVLINGSLFRHGQVVTKKIATGGKQDESGQKQQE